MDSAPPPPPPRPRGSHLLEDPARLSPSGAGVGGEERLKLYPLSAWGQGIRPPRFLHRQNPHRIFLKFSFTSCGSTFGTF